MIKLSLDDHRLHLGFDHDVSLGERTLLKEVRGHEETRRLFSIPLSYASIYQVQRRFGDIDLSESVQSFLLKRGIIPDTKHPNWDLLRDDQKFIIQELLGMPHRGVLLGLVPRVGKTPISIVGADLVDAKSILIVAPLSLLKTWEREIQKWSTNNQCRIVRSIDDIYPDRWMITNYDFISRHLDQFGITPFDLLIIDESILVKNRQSKRSKAIETIAMNSRRVWELSGAPISRTAEDLYQQFRILLPNMFTSFWRFAEEYCIIQPSPWGPQITGTRPTIDLQREFADLMIVRDSSYLFETEEIHETIYIDLEKDQRRLHDRLVKEFVLELSTGDTPVANRMAQIQKLLQIVSTPECLDEDFSDGKTKYLVENLGIGSFTFPMIIWTHWKKTSDHIARSIAKEFSSIIVRTLNAESTDDERFSLVEDFQNHKIDILIVSLGVGKYGLTLSEGRTVVYYDRWFDADAIFQSAHRTRRVGKHPPVSIITLHGDHSADDLVDGNIAIKLSDIRKITNADLAGLIQSLSLS